MLFAHLSLFLLPTVTAAFYDVVCPMEEQFTKAVKSVAFPVFHPFSQLVDSGDALLFVYRFIGLLQDSGGHRNAFCDLFLFIIVQVAFVS